jgi:hypothetical protein
MNSTSGVGFWACCGVQKHAADEKLAHLAERSVVPGAVGCCSMKSLPAAGASRV